MTSVNSLAARAAQERQHGSGFWIVAYAFLILMAFATLPSPLYGLYRTRDHLSSLMITVIYAIFAAGTIASLLAVRSIAARIGRRGVMLSAVATMDGGSRVARRVEGAARIAHRATDHGGVGRAGGGHRDA